MAEFKIVSRRDFMRISIWAIGGGISLAMGLPSITYIIGKSLSKESEQPWVSLGSKTKVEIGTPTLFKTNISHTAGWIEEEQEHSVYLLTEDGRDYIAMSNICTHLGCRVRWVDNEQQFYCPCHAGVFNKQGNVVSGPPPRPLDRYEIKLENDQIFIGQLYKVEG